MTCAAVCLALLGCARTNLQNGESPDLLLIEERLAPPTAQEALSRVLANTSVYFARGFDFIDESGSVVLAGHARFLAAQPQLTVQLVAYADDTAELKDNFALAKSRAETVKRELINIGVDRQRFFRPVVQGLWNADQRSLTANRRVDIYYVGISPVPLGQVGG